MLGTLYLVATPIGNLKDISKRAIDVLKNVDVIACEDTRHTRKLLNHLGINNRLVSYHLHNEAKRAAELARRLANGSSIAVVSDAGMPGISDPAHQIVRQAIEIGAAVVPIPGPTAFAAALAASGLRTDTFLFDGFLPSRKSARRNRLAQLADIPATLVFYEAPHRLVASLADCLDVLGDRPAVVARELTKIHEELVRGTLSALVDEFRSKSVKGEIVLLIDRSSDTTEAITAENSLINRVAELESSGLDRRTALKQAAREFGLSRSEAYRQLQNAKNY